VTDERARERLRWRCRRGMLELDLLFQRFLEQEFPALTPAELAALERLVELPDPELLDYCYGHAIPADPEFRALVQKLVR
jgi:antitoxin CptB